MSGWPSDTESEVKKYLDCDIVLVMVWLNEQQKQLRAAASGDGFSVNGMSAGNSSGHGKFFLQDPEKNFPEEPAAPCP